MLEIVMFIWGIMVLMTGKFSSKKGIVTGDRARMIGLVLISPVPLVIVGRLVMSALGYAPTGWFGMFALVEVLLVVCAFVTANALARNGAREVTKGEEVALSDETAKAAAAAIKQNVGQLADLRQELAPLKRYRKRIIVLSMLGGALATGTPTFIVLPAAGIFASLLGIGLGFLLARLFLLVNSEQRGVSARLRLEERIIEELEVNRQKVEHDPNRIIAPRERGPTAG